MPSVVHLLVLVFVLGTAGPAMATYSIVAADRQTGEVGGASASCVGTTDLGRIYSSVPGLGVFHAQALLGSPTRAQGLALLAEGQAPADVLRPI
ncbi:MAG: DUF1028 domain-containing protein, partial [Myxococcota bacterium]